MREPQLDMSNETQVSVRLPADVPQRAEDLAELLSGLPEFQAFRMTRAAVLRMAMIEGLAALEERYSEQRGRTTGKTRRKGGTKR